jgi:hypothetical protein
VGKDEYESAVASGTHNLRIAWTKEELNKTNQHIADFFFVGSSSPACAKKFLTQYLSINGDQQPL